MIFFLLFFSTFLMAADFSAEMTLSDEEISSVEPLTVALTLTYPPSYTPDVNAIRSHLLTYTGFGTPPFTLDKEQIALPKLTFTLSPQMTGQFSLTFLNIPFTNAEGATKEVLSPLLPVIVSEAEVDIAYRGVLTPLLTYTPQFPIALSPSNRYQLIDSVQGEERARNLEIFRQRRITWGEILLLLGTCVLLAFPFFYKPRIRIKSREQQVKEAKERALSSLSGLQVQERHLEVYTVKLTDIIRIYIAECYDLKMRTLTTQEFLQEIQEHPIFKKDASSLLTDFLKLADQVKFAHYAPTATDCEKAQQSAENFVQITSSRLLFQPTQFVSNSEK